MGKDFSVSLLLKNKCDSFMWIFSVVYGPTVSQLRTSFLLELRDICNLGPAAVLILLGGGVRKLVILIIYVLSSRFNACIADLELLEISLNDRKFTWARSVSSNSNALLDRFFCTTEWNSHFHNSGAFSLPRIQSDHNPIIVSTQAVSFRGNKFIRFEQDWLHQDGFSELVIKWLHSYPLSCEWGNGWRLKLQFLRQKLRGWNNNFRAQQRLSKKQILLKLDRFEKLAENDDLLDSDIQQWHECQLELKQIFKDEELYWQNRAKVRWLLEGDANTKFFHIQASVRKKKNSIFALLIDGSLV